MRTAYSAAHLTGPGNGREAALQPPSFALHADIAANQPYLWCMYVCG